MPRIFLVRHAESTANASDMLAGRMDVPLSSAGKDDAAALAASFAARHKVRRIWTSPLLRALQTAAPFVTACDAPLRIDERLTEQHLGRFSGRTYREVEGDPAYCRDRTARWDWIPEGGGESYRMIASRVGSFLEDLLRADSAGDSPGVLIVTHAVTLRLFRAVLEGTLPKYPERIAGNGEVWMAEPQKIGEGTEVHTLLFDRAPRLHRA